jgi:hypothetical protein
MSEHLEGMQVVFILEALPAEIFEKQNMDSVYLHHPCPSSRWEGIRNGAGRVVESLWANVKSVPSPDLPGSEASAAKCCGNGGGLSGLSPALADRFLDSIIGEAAGRTMVTYCTGCQNRFLQQGAEAVHLLEWLPGVKPRRRIPSPLAQWANRLFLALATRSQTGIFVARIIILQPFFRRIGENKTEAIHENMRNEERK